MRLVTNLLVVAAFFFESEDFCARFDNLIPARTFKKK